MPQGPIGMLQPWAAGALVPKGWVWVQGQPVADYPDLAPAWAAEHPDETHLPTWDGWIVRVS